MITCIKCNARADTVSSHCFRTAPHPPFSLWLWNISLVSSLHVSLWQVSLRSALLQILLKHFSTAPCCALPPGSSLQKLRQICRWASANRSNQGNFAMQVAYMDELHVVAVLSAGLTPVPGIFSCQMRCLWVIRLACRCAPVKPYFPTLLAPRTQCFACCPGLPHLFGSPIGPVEEKSEDTSGCFAQLSFVLVYDALCKAFHI